LSAQGRIMLYALTPEGVHFMQAFNYGLNPAAELAKKNEPWSFTESLVLKFLKSTCNRAGNYI